MRIIFLDTKPIRRGAQIFCHDLSGHFRENGVDVKRVYLFKNENQISLSLDKEDENFNGNEKNIQEKILTIQPMILIKLVKCIKKYNPDIILLNGSKNLKYGAFAKKILGEKYKFVYRIIDSPKFWNTSKITQLYYRKLIIPSIDAAIGVSNASLGDMKSLYNFKKKTEVIHRAVNFVPFNKISQKEVCRQELNISKNKKVILFLGNLTHQKRPDRFVEIIKRLTESEKNIQGIIVGDGTLRNEVLNQIKINNLDLNITFFGYQKEVGKFISSSDVLLLTSDTEGLPGIVPEAGYFSVPTIASNVGGINECLNDGASGFIVEKDVIEEYIIKLKLILNDDVLRTKLGAAAKIIAEEKFNINKVSKSYYEFFNSLI